jgi:hypothetical protein
MERDDGHEYFRLYAGFDFIPVLPKIFYRRNDGRIGKKLK